jgi:hypothetical protein
MPIEVLVKLSILLVSYLSLEFLLMTNPVHLWVYNICKPWIDTSSPSLFVMVCTYFDSSPPTDEELSADTHVFFTGDNPWELQTINDEYPFSSMELEEDAIISPEYHADSLNEYGRLI